MCRWRDHSPTVTVGFTNKTVEFVDNETVCYACGNHICFLRLDTKLQSVLQGPGRAIGALTASGKSGIFAFSEQKLSPSIFVYVYPELQLKNELKGTAQLDYTSLTLSDGGPYLGCCSSLPDHTITVWNWETAEQICTRPQAGKDVVSLVFNPLSCLQLCALGSTSITVWNIERSASLHVLKPSVIELPATDGSFAERLGPTSYPVRAKPPYFGPELPPVFTQTKLSTKARLTPSTICWTSTSKLLVGCAEGFLLLIDPVSRSVSVLFNPTSKQTHKWGVILHNYFLKNDQEDFILSQVSHNFYMATENTFVSYSDIQWCSLSYAKTHYMPLS
uniref:Cilia- and flagella-associated protein 43 n=1 Tax=Scophthalmus maximus TaxID=52904 RepID=A0A8D3DD13_SCOMX